MARKFAPQIITANDLFEGDVVYFTKGGTWSRAFDEAHVAHSPEQVSTMLELAQKDAAQIVGAYAANVDFDENNLPVPAHFRETFRKTGPSNYFCGKQVDIETASEKMVA